jgi:hypothetical protein
MTDDEDDDDNAGQGRDGALKALYEAADDPQLRTQYAIAIAAFEPADYEHLIALAWRYQFDDDRTHFKRDLRKLQEHVSQRILDRLELSE